MINYYTADPHHCCLHCKMELTAFNKTNYCTSFCEKEHTGKPHQAIVNHGPATHLQGMTAEDVVKLRAHNAQRRLISQRARTRANSSAYREKHPPRKSGVQKFLDLRKTSAAV